MRTAWVLLLLLQTSTLYAVDYKEELPLKGHPIEQYFMVVSGAGAESKLYRAAIEKTETTCVVSANLPELPAATLIGAILVMAEGTVVSGPLHRADSDELTREPETVALARIKNLRSQISSAKSKNEELEQSLKTLNSDLRKRAGLADVDLVYDKIDKLDAELAKFETPLKE